MAHRVYLDTSVLVFFFITNFEPKFSNASKEFLKRVESGKYEGLISLFALMELIKQLRELLVKANIVAKKDWEESTKRAIEAIYKMQNIKIIEGSSQERKTVLTVSNVSHSEIAWERFDIINKYQGRVGLRNSKLQHDGIHPVDAVHVVLAKKMGC